MASIKKNEIVGAYKVQSDDGESRTVIVWAVVVYTHLGNSTIRNVGTKSHKMPNGNHLNPNDDGTLLEVATGKIWRRTRA
jgi:hypothetical protein